MTRLMRLSEKKCSSASKFCVDDWSPELKHTYKMKRSLKQELLKLQSYRKCGKNVTPTEIEILRKKLQATKEKARNIKQEARHYREQYLLMRAGYIIEKRTGERNQKKNRK